MIPASRNKMKTATFTNFTDRDFTGYWDGKAKLFKPGASVCMPAYLAAHYAKHLTNAELLRTDKEGNLLHRDGDKMTSPKRPEDFPLFMELFNKAYTPDEEEGSGSDSDDPEALSRAAQKNKVNLHSDIVNKEPQVIKPPDFDEEDEFEDKPKE